MKFKALFILTVILAAVCARYSYAGASGDHIKVVFRDRTSQMFHMDHDTSEIRRVMVDKEKDGDRVVVTYADDTHQVFKLKKNIEKVKSMTFEDGVRKGPKAARKKSAKAVKEVQEAMPPPARSAPPAPVNIGRPIDSFEGDYQMGRVWKVTEACGGEKWTGTWTRRGNTNTFDGIWVSNSGKKRSGIVQIAEVRDNYVKLYRPAMNGYYEGELSQDGIRVLNGWASWYEPLCSSWYAVIE